MAKSAFNRILDADNAFRVPGSVAITANGVTLSPEISLDKLSKARGDQKDNLGGPAYEVVVIVESVDINPVATITLSAALAVGATFTVDDGTNALDTLVSNTDFTAGVSAIADAISLAAAINASTATGLVANDDGAGVVFVENTLTTTGAIVDTVDVGDIATVVDFGAAVDESYTIDVEVGPAGFASSTVVSSLSIAAASVGHQIVAIDADTLAKQNSDHVAARTKLTVVDGGVNTASIAYAAWIL
jgi:hypothetical protein